MKTTSSSDTMEKHRPILRRIAAECMVLLKNTAAQLPLTKGVRVALFGSGLLHVIKGGAGSADIFSGQTVGLCEALLEAESEKTITLHHDLLASYQAQESYWPDAATIAKTATESDVAVWVICRNSGEGLDREDAPGDFLLTEAEKKQLELLKQHFAGRLVVVLNTCGVISLAELADAPGVSAILYAGLPGGEAGHAIADVLLGKVNPSGRLPDTWAAHYSDYPSSQSFRRSKFRVDYEEGIFVGYRWFESDEQEAQKVIYPLAHGLSYTTFSHQVVDFGQQDYAVQVRVRVTNTGSLAGKESITFWSSFSGISALPRPAVELRDFAKTRLLNPGESEELTLAVKESDLAVFDEAGAIAAPGSFVLERGAYEFSIGGSVRERVWAGRITIAENKVPASPGNKLTDALARTLIPGQAPQIAPGVVEEMPDADTANLAVESSFIDALGEMRQVTEESVNADSTRIKLTEVGTNGISLDDFVNQLTPRELLSLCQAQLPAVLHGTSSIGNMRRLGVPAAQTADGPAGVRLAVAASTLPCPTLAACSLDRELLFELGSVMGREAEANGIDVMLAPGMNVHRDPLCGRNFEYYSEDPVISGLTAAYMVRGIQSTGVSATLKHFAVNNKEEYRFFSSSTVSERALREIYLKNFEIAVKVGKPNCIMSAYNYLNRIKVSTFRNLLSGILREEWGFDGLVMTDWRNDSHLWQELLAGNDIKMPFGYPEELELALSKLGTLLPIECVKQSAGRVLKLVMKTNAFRKRYFGKVFFLKRNEPFVIEPPEISEISCNITKLERVDDTYGEYCHTRLWKDQRNQDIFLRYFVQAEAGQYAMSIRTAAVADTTELEVRLDGQSVGTLPVAITLNLHAFQNTGTWTLDLTGGEHVLDFIVRDATGTQAANIGAILFHPKIQEIR